MDAIRTLDSRWRKSTSNRSVVWVEYDSTGVFRQDKSLKGVKIDFNFQFNSGFKFLRVQLLNTTTKKLNTLA